MAYASRCVSVGGPVVLQCPRTMPFTRREMPGRGRLAAFSPGLISGKCLFEVRGAILQVVQLAAPRRVGGRGVRERALEVLDAISDLLERLDGSEHRALQARCLLLEREQLGPVRLAQGACAEDHGIERPLLAERLESTVHLLREADGVPPRHREAGPRVSIGTGLQCRAATGRWGWPPGAADPRRHGGSPFFVGPSMRRTTLPSPSLTVRTMPGFASRSSARSSPQLGYETSLPCFASSRSARCRISFFVSSESLR